VTWHGEPFVVSAGADVDRRTTASVAADSVLALRETLVFGRSGQTGGTLRTHARISCGGVPVLDEDLDLSPDARAGWATLRGHRCLDTVTTVGARLPDGPGVLQADARASLARCLCDEVHRSTMPRLWSAARALTLPRIRA